MFMVALTSQIASFYLRAIQHMFVYVIVVNHSAFHQNLIIHVKSSDVFYDATETLVVWLHGFQAAQLLHCVGTLFVLTR